MGFDCYFDDSGEIVDTLSQVSRQNIVKSVAGNDRNRENIGLSAKRCEQLFNFFPQFFMAEHGKSTQNYFLIFFT